MRAGVQAGAAHTTQGAPPRPLLEGLQGWGPCCQEVSSSQTSRSCSPLAQVGKARLGDMKVSQRAQQGWRACEGLASQLPGLSHTGKFPSCLCHCGATGPQASGL